MKTGRATLACVVSLMFACGHEAKPSPNSSPSPTSSTIKSPAPAPKRLVTLPVSAYQATITMDDDAAYLLTSTAAYRLVDGEPAQGLRLDLGVGSALTRTSFVFWSNGSIWSAPKETGSARELAKFPHQPQYFVSSGAEFAWVDQSDDGLYTIQSLEGRKPRVLLSSMGEIRALDMIGEVVYFVRAPSS